jgi:hypothetical protein
MYGNETTKKFLEKLIYYTADMWTVELFIIAVSADWQFWHRM